MAAPVDYARLRDQTLGSGQEEEAVTVNTRALIDKVLARYSGEWTTFRELIQNAADASATRVSIKFETLPSSTVPFPRTSAPSDQLKHVVLNHTVRRVVVTNDGQAFNENDWSRLKRIAEGNPDETKIGAFGVGFYSVFADCEDPFITSGQQTMAFYWKGNSLFTRRGRLPQEHEHQDTSFVLDYRNTTSSIPNLISICHFLSSSLTFIGLEKIELHLDGWNLFTLNKKSAPSSVVSIPKDLDTKTKQGMMRISGVDCQSSQIDASWMNIVGWTPVANDKTPTTPSEPDRGGQSLRSFFSRLTGSSQNNAAVKRAAKEEEVAQRAIAEDLTGRSSATVFTRVNTVQVKTQVALSFAAELERATKKSPPKQTTIAILTSSFDETAASMSTLTGTAARKAADIITSILPSRSGRIFIGFPTAQTTGLLAHISAPSLIPTVERESIDLNARWVREWNTELLHVAGIACRIAYAGEMSSLRNKVLAESKTKGQGQISDGDVELHQPAAIHTLQQYTFQESTPLARAGQIIEEAFWTCGKKASIEMFSSRGVLPSHDVRIASENLSFVGGIPVVPEDILKEAKDFVSKLQDLGIISDITTSDIHRELEKQALSEEQLSEFLKWAALKVKTNDIDTKAIQSLLNVTVANIANEDGKQSSVLQLSQITSFLNGSRIGPENPTPPETVPFRISKDIRYIDMQGFGWEELQLVPWLRWLLSNKGYLNMTSSPEFAAQVLTVISKNWDNVSQPSKSTIVEMLSVRTVIPTKIGMKLPPESYFASVKLFDDLPIIVGLYGVKDKLLKALGVRKTIELHVIFSRLMAKSSGDSKGHDSGWSHVDLIRYLVSVWNDIPQEDIAQLKTMPICPAEKDGDQKQTTAQRYRVSELFEPKEDLRALGLSILQWPGPINPYNADGKFLRLLGIRPYPSVPELFDVLLRAKQSKNSTLYEYGIRYFIQNHYQNNYGSFDLSAISSPILPIQSGEPFQFVKPSDCFSDSKAGVLLYPILREDLQPHAAKLGVAQDPPITDCAVRLVNRPPTNRADARKMFGYLATRATDINQRLAEHLGRAAIVPLTPRVSDRKEKDGVGADKVRMVTPTSCFLGDGQEYGDIFDYVDFGEEANVFLLKAGCKHEPSNAEIARLVLAEPSRIFKALGPERYKGLLRRLHVNMATLKKDKILWRDMKATPFLMAYKERPATQNGADQKSGADFMDEEVPLVVEWRLRSADKVVVQDDLISYTLFREHLVVAPQEENLEEFYLALGSSTVSSIVEAEPRLGPRLGNQKEAEDWRDLILERSRLFLHEQSPSSIRHEVKWLEKNLEVQLVQSISLRRTLKGFNQAHTERRMAALTSGTRGMSTLSITSNPDVWQVSHAIVTLLIDRPKTQTTMIFETFLRTSLLMLRSRGYNVDRILRKRQAEDARVAELERQRQEELRLQQQAERQRAEEAERNRPTPAPLAISASARENGDLPPDEPQSPQRPLMPGAFNDSPDRQQDARQGRKGLLSSLTRGLGLDSTRSPAQQLQQLVGGGRQAQNPLAPPPYTEFDPQQPRGMKDTETVTHPSNIQQNLQRAIAASRPYGSSTLFSHPETNVVKETGGYCDTKSGHDLAQLSSTASGMKIYTNPRLPNQISFLAENQPGLESFAALILACGNVFDLSPSTLHIFYDATGSTIAFNQSGSIFCNYRFFAQLHLAGMQNPQLRAQAVTYWWVTLCHELAHNLVSDHSANHSYYTEQFVAQYFPAVAGLVFGMGAQAAVGNVEGGTGPTGAQQQFERTFL